MLWLHGCYTLYGVHELHSAVTLCRLSRMQWHLVTSYTPCLYNLYPLPQHAKHNVYLVYDVKIQIPAASLQSARSLKMLMSLMSMHKMLIPELPWQTGSLTFLLCAWLSGWAWSWSWFLKSWGAAPRLSDGVGHGAKPLFTVMRDGKADAQAAIERAILHSTA